MQKSRKEKLNYSLFNLKKTEILAYLCHSRSFNCQTWDFTTFFAVCQALIENFHGNFIAYCKKITNDVKYYW